MPWDTGQKTGSYRGLRGGNWNNNSNNLASSNRNNNNPTNENNNVGFRVAKPLDFPSWPDSPSWDKAAATVPGSGTTRVSSASTKAGGRISKRAGRG